MVATHKTTPDANGGGQGANSSEAACYFPRHLRITGDAEQMRQVEEADLLSIAGPKILLGEPGMGKSELIRELGRKLNVQPVTAVRFMLNKNPAALVVVGKPLLIDGLDEAMARREGDAVDMVLAQLEHAGCPDFILSCRAREWQSRSMTQLRQVYGAEPTVLTIDALSRADARAFLGHRYPGVDPEHVLDHLDENSIGELYSNPLTLKLMGQVAEHDLQLPATRGALFNRVCTLIWPEHDPDRQDGGLAKITEDQAVSAAGAIMAGLLLAGADAASLSGPGHLQEGDVRLADIEVLPGAGAARAVFSSKLFQSVGVGRAKPIHRVVAEFLGARWLAQQAATTRARRRLLVQFQGSGAVPASLRGLHAWLAFHSSAMAKTVIDADPFGVLRYGDTADLTSDQADCMFSALETLAEIDPYFRARDWDSHASTGLMHPNLHAKIRTTITSSTSNGHLRSLLIEGLKDMTLAGDLAEALENVMFSTDRVYNERKYAAHALQPHRDRGWWQDAIDRARAQGTEDSTALARNLVEEIDCDVTDELLVATLLAEMGATISPLPRMKHQRVHALHRYRHVVAALPAARLGNVLNLISDHASLFGDAERRIARDLAEVAFH